MKAGVFSDMGLIKENRLCSFMIKWLNSPVSYSRVKQKSPLRVCRTKPSTLMPLLLAQYLTKTEIAMGITTITVPSMLFFNL